MFSYNEAPRSKIVRRVTSRLIAFTLIALYLCALLSTWGTHPGAEHLLEALILVARFEVPHTLPILLSALGSAGVFALLFRRSAGMWRQLLELCLPLPCLLELLLHSVW